MSHLADRILQLPPAVALLLVFALPALEASAFIGFVIPGEIGVILGGVLANQHKIPLWAALAAGITGAVIGDSVGYEVGKRYGERLLTKIPNRVLKPEHLDRAEKSIRHQGGKAVRRCSSAVSPPRYECWYRACPGRAVSRTGPSWPGTWLEVRCGRRPSSCSAMPRAASTSASHTTPPCSASACSYSSRV